MRKVRFTKQNERRLYYVEQHRNERLRVAEERAAQGLPAFTWDANLRRVRYKRFVEVLIIEWLRTGSLEHAATRAAQQTFTRRRLSDKTAKKKGMELIQRPDICVAVEAAFSEEGFTFSDMVKLHIQHIKGGLVKRTKSVKQTPEGVETTTTEEELLPSYQALKDLEHFVIHRPATRFVLEPGGSSPGGGNVLASFEGEHPEMATDEFPRITARVERERTELEPQSHEDQSQDAQEPSESTAPREDDDASPNQSKEG